MIVKLLPQQIPYFWESIKFATTQADEVEKVFFPRYLNKLLQALLSDNSQCFVKLDDKRRLINLTITRVAERSSGCTNELLIQCLYSWHAVDDNSWKEDFVFVREFAQRMGCSTIYFESRHKRIHEIGTMLGFHETTRVFTMGV